MDYENMYGTICNTIMHANSKTISATLFEHDYIIHIPKGKPGVAAEPGCAQFTEKNT